MEGGEVKGHKAVTSCFAREERKGAGEKEHWEINTGREEGCRHPKQSDGGKEEGEEKKALSREMEEEL